MVRLMINNRKYVLHSGYVKSTYDGDIHHISAYELVNLYGLKREDCVIARPHICYPKDYIHLWPDSTGKYEIK